MRIIFLNLYSKVKRIKKSHVSMTFINYLDKIEATLALSSSPLKFIPIIIPFSFNKNVAGIPSTLYLLAIGSSHPCKFET